MIEEFINKFTQEKISYLQIKRQYFQANKKVMEIQEKIGREPYSVGLLLGEEKNKMFNPSANLLDWISLRTDKKIFVNKKGEWMFLCGKIVLGDNILLDKGIAASIIKEKKDVLVLIQDELDENLGLGKIFFENKSVHIKNILDKGKFLRENKT